MNYSNEKKEYDDYFAAIEQRLITPKVETKNDIPKQKTAKSKNNFKFFSFKIVLFVLVILIVLSVVVCVKSCDNGDEVSANETTEEIVRKTEKKEKSLFPSYDNQTTDLSSEISSEAVIFIDDDKNEVVASRNPQKRMYPASTTKIMTLLVATENITDYNDTFKITYQITDPLFKVGATVAGFSASEVVNMNDLIYGLILPSGGDAAIALAQKIAGSEEAFVELMNKKAKQLKLKDTHFANPTGLFDKENYTTAEDLSVVLREALKSDICKKVLSTQKFVTSKTAQHPDGLELENTLFKYMYGTEPEGASVLGGKTGFVNESGYCIASFGESESGKTYVCVALNGESRWPAVYDQINLYTEYAK